MNLRQDQARVANSVTYADAYGYENGIKLSYCLLSIGEDPIWSLFSYILKEKSGPR